VVCKQVAVVDVIQLAIFKPYGIEYCIHHLLNFVISKLLKVPSMGKPSQNEHKNRRHLLQTPSPPLPPSSLIVPDATDRIIEVSQGPIDAMQSKIKLLFGHQMGVVFIHHP